MRILVKQLTGTEILNDEPAAELVTVITSTSPIPSMPSVTHLGPAQKSLFKVAVFAKCKKIIVFDGLPPKYQQRNADYEAYKRRIMKLTRNNSYFSNTELVFCNKWEHLSGSIKRAIEHVKTPFVFIHQHDNILIKKFDIKGCMLSMIKNPNIKRIHLPIYINSLGHSGEMLTTWNGPVDTYVEGGSEIPLSRCFGWSDYGHLTMTDYLKHFVLPKCGHGFMETFLQKAFKNSLRGKSSDEIKTIHLSFGTYLYGGLMDGRFMRHSDGREANR